MSNIERGYFCMYGHFSQPPRGNPLSEEIGQEDDAAPYENWNERISDRCYEPNASAENFRHMSFSFSESLLVWLEAHKPEVYQAIIKGDGAQDNGQGNALATAYHHSILPLARRRDKRTQILWGIAAFEHHFGRKPLGFWLPEMAVDTETLTLLAQADIQYTLLAAQQVRDLPFNGGAGPYKLPVSRNQSISVFVRDDRLSSEISFKVHNLGGAGHWAHNVLGPARKASGPLLLIATEGETFGHHYMGEDQFLHWLMTREAQAVGFKITSLDHFFTMYPPTQSVSIHEPSSWSDQRGLANWATGEANNQRDTTWKGALRRALDNAASELDRVYEDLLRPLGVEPWQLRDQYAPVLLGAISVEEFLDQRVPDIESDTAEALRTLLSAQELAQRMYTSATFTNDALDSRQPRYAIACAAAALMLAQRATGRYLADRFLSDLAVVTAKGSSKRGIDILRETVEEFQLDLAE